MRLMPKTKKSAFHRFYGGFLLVLIVAAVSGLGVLWLALRSYEASMPIHGAEQVLTLFEQRRDGEIANYAGYQPCKFEDETAFTRFLDSKLGENPVYSLKKVRNTHETTEFILRQGEEPLATVFLKESEEADLFGNHTWSVDFLKDLWQTEEPLNLYAPEFVTLSINGVELTEEDANGQQEMVTAYRSLPVDYAHPVLTGYTVYGLLHTPVITAKAADGSTCEIAAVENEPNTFLVKPRPSEEEQESLRQLAVESAQAYAKYITMDEAREKVLSYLIPDTEYYKRVRGFYNGWYIEHDSYSFENLEVSDFIRYSPDHVSCKISFLYVVMVGKERFEFPSSYEVYMARTDEGWRVAEMPIL